MTNIPKKLDEQKQPWYDKTLANKVNELIDVVKQHRVDFLTSTGWDRDELNELLGAKEEASKGECICRVDKDTYIMRSNCPVHKPQIVTPPEHEDWEEWTEDEKRYGFKIKNHFNKGEMDYIRENFVSKEKIKREAGETIKRLVTYRDRTISDDESWTAGYKYAIEDCIYRVESLLESLGLGD